MFYRAYGRIRIALFCACALLLLLLQSKPIESQLGKETKLQAFPPPGLAASSPVEPDRTAVVQHAIAPPSDEPYQAFYGAHIQRTMTLLETSNQDRKWPVRILLYGQSI